MKSRFGHDISTIQCFGGPVREAFRRQLLDMEELYNCAIDVRLRVNLAREIHYLESRSAYHAELLDKPETYPIRVYRMTIHNPTPVIIATVPNMDMAKRVKRADDDVNAFYNATYSFAVGDDATLNALED